MSPVVTNPVVTEPTGDKSYGNKPRGNRTGYRISMKSLIASIWLLGAAPAVLAQSELLEFNSTMYSFSADFTQTVYDSDSVALQESAGTVELMRPGRFRWIYTEPNSQTIVADGATLWVYDEDIKQVTVQPQDSALGSAPIGLLSGQKTLESEFTISDLGSENGLQWFELEPVIQDTDFNTVYIALDENGLHAMELRDNFDQATQIKFTNFRKNITLTPDSFVFTTPEGADVLGEMGTPQELDSEGFPKPVTREIGDDEVLENGVVKPVLPAANDTEGETGTAGQPTEQTQQADLETDDTAPDAGEEDNTQPTTIIDGNQLQMQEIRQ